MNDILFEQLNLTKYKTLKFKKNTTTFRDLFDNYYLVLKSGLLASEYYNLYGEGVIFYLIKPYFTIHGINYQLYEQNKDVSLVALTDIEVILIPKGDIKEFIKKKEVVELLFRVEAEILTDVNNKINLNVNFPSHIYLLFILLSLGEYLNSINKSTLATIANISRKHLYANLKKLSDLGYISIEKIITIDIDKSNGLIKQYLYDFIV